MMEYAGVFNINSAHLHNVQMLFLIKYQVSCYTNSFFQNLDSSPWKQAVDWSTSEFKNTLIGCRMNTEWTSCVQRNIWCSHVCLNGTVNINTYWWTAQNMHEYGLFLNHIIPYTGKYVSEKNCIMTYITQYRK